MLLMTHADTDLSPSPSRQGTVCCVGRFPAESFSLIPDLEAATEWVVAERPFSSPRSRMEYRPNPVPFLPPLMVRRELSSSLSVGQREETKKRMERLRSRLLKSLARAVYTRSGTSVGGCVDGRHVQVYTWWFRYTPFVRGGLHCGTLPCPSTDIRSLPAPRSKPATCFSDGQRMSAQGCSKPLGNSES